MPFGLEMIDILSLGAGVSATLVILSVYKTATVARDPMRARMRTLNDRRDALKAGIITKQRRSSPIKKVDGVTLLRTLATKMQLMQNEQTQKLSESLVQAGLRSKDALAIYQIARLVMPMVMGLVAIIFLYGLNFLPGMAKAYPLMAIGMVFVGLKAPDLYVSNLKTNRTAAIRKGLPDALDLLVVCAEAGLTLDLALGRVARELSLAAPELAEEFSLTSIELGFLPDRRKALMNLSERVDLPTLRGVVTTLIQAEKYGTPLAGSLRVLSSEFRNERMMAAETKAAKLPATLTIPLILFILPTLFVVLLGPAACKIAQDFKVN